MSNTFTLVVETQDVPQSSLAYARKGSQVHGLNYGAISSEYGDAELTGILGCKLQLLPLLYLLFPIFLFKKIPGGLERWLSGEETPLFLDLVPSIHTR